jgi:hypothetical protein
MYEIDPKGRLFQIYRTLAGVSPQKRPELPPDAATKELGRQGLKTLYGKVAAVGEPSWEYDPFEHTLTWESARGAEGYPERFTAAVRGSNVVTLGRWVDFPRGGGLIDVEFVLRSFLAALILPLFAMVLFLLRRLHLQPRSLPNLCSAAVVALGLGLAYSAIFWGAPPTEPVERFLFCVVVPVFFFCISLPPCYAVLNTVLYYSRGRFPAQVGSYLALFRDRVHARGAGLALLRGTFAGLAFSGCWMAAVSLAGPHGQALPAMMGWLYYSYREGLGSYGIASLLIPRNFPVLLIGETLTVGWLLVAFPLSLLGRVSRRRRILLPALAALWLALGFSLAGAMVFPTLPYYIFVALQAVFFGALFLRYDLLTTLSAAFTIEILLLAFPFLEIFQQIDPLPYVITIALWAVVLLAAAGLYFRPQLVASYRRVAAVFE